MVILPVGDGRNPGKLDVTSTAQCARCTVGFFCSQNSPGDATKLPSIRHRFRGIICIATGE